jgi:hypothetical protein
MPGGRLDLLPVDGQVNDLVIVVDERVDDGVFFDLPVQFIVDSMVSILSGNKKHIMLKIFTKIILP